MKEIKFRAWCQESHFPTEFDQMLYSEKYTSLADFFFEVERARQDGAKVTVMQYTGLHDKNGKEIYEGDVITSPSVGNLKQGSVEWGTCGFVVREQGVHGSKDGTWTEVLSSWAYPLDGQGALRGEIIGNIYENPDLLSPGSSAD